MPAIVTQLAVLESHLMTEVLRYSVLSVPPYLPGPLTARGTGRHLQAF
jgi:hypothetical protein